MTVRTRTLPRRISVVPPANLIHCYRWLFLASSQVRRFHHQLISTVYGRDPDVPFIFKAIYQWLVFRLVKLDARRHYGVSRVSREPRIQVIEQPRLPRRVWSDDERQSGTGDGPDVRQLQ